MAFDSVKELLQAAKEAGGLWQAVVRDDCKERGVLEADSLARMGRLWQAMKESGAAYDGALRSASGLSGGDGAKMKDYARAGGIGGTFLNEIIAQALQMGESNACMQRIVAAPTAGSCGVLPAVLLPLCRRDHLSDERMVQALLAAAGFGQVVAMRATIAGAEGGCQAEVGTASGMAAAALTFLRGGCPEACAEACSMALQNLLGLVCDPVAGLVEVPCVRRNVIGAVNALSSAEMALAGLNGRLPPDEVIDAMREVGTTLPASLRETGCGGLAATPTGVRIREMMEAHAQKAEHNDYGQTRPENDGRYS